MKLVLNKYIIGQVLCFFLIRLLYVYVTVITLDGLSYAGSGGYHIDYNIQKDILALFIFVPIMICYSMRPMRNDFQSVVLHLLMILYFVPMNVEYAIHDVPASFLVLSSIYMVVMIFILTTKKRMVGEISDDETWLYDDRVVIFSSIICLIFIVYKIAYNGFIFTITIDSDYVYSNRENYNNTIGVFAGTIVGYIITLVNDLQSTLAPILLYIGLRRKKVAYILLAILDFLSEFSLSSMKSTLFIPLIVVAVYVAYRLKWMKDFRKFFNIAFLGIMGVCFLERKLVRVGQFYFLLIRRVMFSPAWLNSMYYEYFSEHPKVWLTDSVIGLQRILPHVYDASPLSKISDAYFGGLMVSPNTGLFATAYMQLGIIGIIVQPILIYFILRWSSKVLQGYGMGLVIVLGCITAMKLQNIPVLRTDFVLSFFLVIFLIQCLRRIKLGNSHFVNGRHVLKGTRNANVS